MNRSITVSKLGLLIFTALFTTNLCAMDANGGAGRKRKRNAPNTAQTNEAKDQEKKLKARFFEAIISGNIALVRSMLDGHPLLIKARTIGRRYSALHLAAIAGHLNITELLLLERDVNVNLRDDNGYTPLHKAICSQQSEPARLFIIRLLLDRGADPNATTNQKFTPLHYAAMKENIAIIQLLLANGGGASLGIKTKRGKTPLDYAESSPNKSLLKAALEAKPASASPEPDKHSLAYILNPTDMPLSPVIPFYTTTPRMGLLRSIKTTAQASELHEAARNGNIDQVRSILERDPSLLEKRTDNGYFRPLHLAAMEGHLDIAQFLIDRRAEVNPTDRSGLTPLHHAARRKRYAIARLLLENGAEINAKAYYNYTPLYFAVFQSQDKDAELIQFLLDKRAKNIKTRRSNATVLDLKTTPLIKQLLEKSFPPSTASEQCQTTGQHPSDSDSETEEDLDFSLWPPDVTNARIYHEALFGASLNDHEKIARILLNLGANVNIQNNNGETPLHFASARGCTRIIELLIHRGAKPDIAEEKQNLTALDMASTSEIKEFIRTLADRANQPFAASEQYPTKDPCIVLPKNLPEAAKEHIYYEALFGAASNGDESDVAFLLNYGTGVNVQNESGETPLHFASYRNHTRVAELLIRNRANLHTCTQNGLTPLSIAKQRGNTELIALLRKQDATQ